MRLALYIMALAGLRDLLSRMSRTNHDIPTDLQSGLLHNELMGVRWSQ